MTEGLKGCFNPRSPFPGSDAGVHPGAAFGLAVSIHAPRFQGAMRQREQSMIQQLQFQSTLPVSRERCTDSPRFRNDTLVSIHAPRFQGAMLLRFYSKRGFAMFQSTLPVSRERCACGSSGRGALWPVSIHAPRFQGAMRGALHGDTGATLFQSTLPVSRERCLVSRLIATKSASFNPRSPFPGSDAVLARQVQAVSFVSIHAPRFQGAMPWYAPMVDGSVEFQSTLPVSRERCKNVT